MWLSKQFALPAWVLVLVTVLSAATGYWLGNTVPMARYELRDSVSGGGTRFPVIVDGRTGDTWMFIPGKGWNYYAPPKRPYTSPSRLHTPPKIPERMR